MIQHRVSPYAQELPRTRAPRPGPARPGTQGSQGALRPNGQLGRNTGGTTGHSATGEGVGLLTGLGVSLLLLAACVFGSLLDLFLVGGPAWAVVALYIGACGYTASRVRGADWYAALVAPPIAFGVAMILLAELMPASFGPGLLGFAATTLELLAAKTKALYCGAALSAVILCVRRTRSGRQPRR